MLIIIQFVQMKKILAVSGGVDSVVMLHRMRNDPDVVVAHFDHGIRENSSEDAEFVRRLAEGYRLPFELGVGKLGSGASEAVAREARWKFLFGLCNDEGKVYTAHHRDDVVETVTINFLRGTGWRGLAVLGNSEKAERPLIEMSKIEIYRYAGENGLHFRQDQTNNEDDYLRNRVRERLRDLPGTVNREIAGLAKEQNLLRDEIDEVIESCLGCVASFDAEKCVVDKEVLSTVTEEIQLEIVRAVTMRTMKRSLTREQLGKMLSDTLTLRNGKKISFGKEYFIEITRESVIFPIGVS